MRPPRAQNRRTSDQRLERVDPAIAARGAWRGFAILLLGGLSLPLAAAVVPPLGSVWLTVTAVLAFTVAAWNAGAATVPALQGAVNALAGYLLILPLVFMSTQPSALQIAATTIVAAVTGSVTGLVRGRVNTGRRPR